MRIGIDIDDVLSDFFRGWNKRSQELLGIPGDLELQPTSWDWGNYGYTPEQLSTVWDNIRNDPEFYGSLATIVSPYFGNALSRLDSQHDLYFMTARKECKVGESMTRATKRWFKNHLLITDPTVLCSKKKGLLAEALDLNYFLDDNVDNCKAVRFHAPACKVYFKSMTHNLIEGAKYPNLPKVDTFEEFAKIILGDKQ